MLAFQISWQSLAPLPEPRAALLHAVVEGRLLAAGGTQWQDGQKLWSRRCDFFDPQTNTWSPGAPLPMPRADSATVEVGGDTFFLGGTSDGRVLDDVIVFDGMNWRSKPEMRLPAPRSYAQAAFVKRRVYLFGGLEKAGDIASARSDVWMWNLDRPNDGWTRVSQIPEPARSNYGFGVLDGKAYLFGGVSPTANGFHNLAESWSYDFGRNEWTALPDVPVATRAWAAVAVQNSILLLGGYTDRFVDTVLNFSPRSKKMQHSGRLPHGLADARFLQIGERLYVTGGESGMKVRSPGTWEGRPE